MSSEAYYWCWTLPFIFGVAGLAFGSGFLSGWLLWSHYPRETRSLQSENDRLRDEIRRLTA